MIKARDRNRDELRKFYTFLKEETGAEGVPSRSLGSKEECLKAIREIIKENKNTFLKNWRKAAGRLRQSALYRQQWRRQPPARCRPFAG